MALFLADNSIWQSNRPLGAGFLQRGHNPKRVAGPGLPAHYVCTSPSVSNGYCYSPVRNNNTPLLSGHREELVLCCRSWLRDLLIGAPLSVLPRPSRFKQPALISLAPGKARSPPRANNVVLAPLYVFPISGTEGGGRAGHLIYRSSREYPNGAIPRTIDHQPK